MRDPMAATMPVTSPPGGQSHLVIPTLALPLTLGLVFGIGQQLRGAHFLSHDLWTAWLCWLCASLSDRAFFPSAARVPAL